MQLKYNRQPKIGNTIFRILIKIILVIVVIIFSIKKIAKTKTTTTKINLIRILNNVFPIFGCLLYLSCILFEFI